MPPDRRYQPFYCEENIWHLAHDRLHSPTTGQQDRVVFISNQQRTVALWSQHAASQTGEPVIWDYHVVLLNTEPLTPVIWDLDSILQHPAALPRWWRGTFPLEETCPDHLQPTFRVVDSEHFIDTFSSNRSHMRTDSTDADTDFLKPPPAWKPIFKPAKGMNLPDFVDMQNDFIGDVMSHREFKHAFHPQASRSM
jgi:hypothetical protein